MVLVFWPRGMWLPNQSLNTHTLYWEAESTTGSPGQFLFHSFLWLSSTPLCKCTSSSLSIHQLRDLYKVTFHETDIKIPDKLNWAPTHCSNQRSTQPHLPLTQHARNVLCLPWPPLSAHAGPIDMSSSPVQGKHSPGFEFNSLYLVWPLTNVFLNKPWFCHPEKRDNNNIVHKYTVITEWDNSCKVLSMLLGQTYVLPVCSLNCKIKLFAVL